VRYYHTLTRMSDKEHYPLLKHALVNSGENGENFNLFYLIGKIRLDNIVPLKYMCFNALHKIYISITPDIEQMLPADLLEEYKTYCILYARNIPSSRVGKKTWAKSIFLDCDIPS